MNLGTELFSHNYVVTAYTSNIEMKEVFNMFHNKIRTVKVSPEKLSKYLGIIRSNVLQNIPPHEGEKSYTIVYRESSGLKRVRHKLKDC